MMSKAWPAAHAPWLWCVLCRVQHRPAHGVQSKLTAVAPLTSFDWAGHDASRIVTCSIDSSCAIWDVEVRLLARRTSVVGALCSCI